MNELLLILEIIIVFSLVITSDKIFKKEGLIGWICIASIIANIQVIKNINILGLSATLGNVMFASNFLATDILSIKYGIKYSKKGINMGLFATITLLITSQIAIRFIPNEFDIVHDSMVNIFKFSPRICLSSLTMYYISNIMDIYVFEKLKNKKLWIRNNISTILCNCTENILFTLLSFTGIFNLRTMIEMIISTSILEIIIAICDTPFLYLSNKGGD